MNHTTNDRGGAGASARRVGPHPARFAARAAGAMAVAVAVGLGPAACGGGDEQLDPAVAGVTPTGTAAPATPATAVPATDDPIGGSGTGGSGTGSGGGRDDGDEQPTGRPPRIVAPSVEPYVEDGELVAEVLGHAFDDDGPDPQLRVDRVEVQWGDGTTTTTQLDGHGVFRDYHVYDLSYEGQTVTVRIVAYGHDGQTASEAVPVELPR